MAGNIFNIGRYFDKDKKDPAKTENQTSVSYQETSTTTTPSGPYSGIGKTPGGGQPYSGIGYSPSQKTNVSQMAIRQVNTSTSPVVAQDKSITSGSQLAAKPGASSIDMNKRSGMDILTRLTQRSTQALMVGVNKAKALGAKYIDTEHVLWGLLQDAQIYQLISELKVAPKEIQDYLEKNFKKANFSGQPQFSPRVKRVLELSLATARALEYEFISPEHILLALVQEGEGMAAQALVKFNITVEVLNKKVTGKKQGINEEEKSTKSVINQYCDDLTAKAKEGKLDPVVGRSVEIERVIHILSRRTKNNPVLIGDAGVGKTAIVEGLAQKIAVNDVPETLLNKKILQLDLMSLIAGAKHRGEFEERLKDLIKEVKSAAGAYILFIDEIHNMVGAGSGGEGTMDASNILKPSLARGELQTIGTTTITEYRKYIEKDPALERRFQPVQVLEPSTDQAIEMLHAIRDRYEAFHKVSIPDETIEAAVKLSKKYVGDRFLPDKAVDLIDEAAAAVRLPAISLPEEIKSLQEKIVRLESEKKEAEKLHDNIRLATIDKETQDVKDQLAEKTQEYTKRKSTTTNIVSPDIIQDIVSRWTNIPVSKITEKETDVLLKLEDVIHKRIINQEQAVSAVSEAVRRGRAGLKSTKRPIGSFIFMGPTGVGKTELAKALAEILFGSEDLMVRIDMTEYMEKHEVAKLIGAPPGYVGYEEGGQLTEAVRRHPYSVVLFDEIEKAHPDVFNILIQILDDGRLTDNKGHLISFKNTIFICTSNIGTSLIQKEMLGPPKTIGVEEKPTPSKTNDDKSKLETGSDTGNQPQIRTSANKGQFIKDDSFSQVADMLLEELRKFFRPELLNRFDEVVVFRPISFDNMIKIVDLQLELLNKLMQDQHFALEVTPPAKERLAILGYDPIYGARPLRRTIQRYLENNISTLLIKGEVKPGDKIIVDLKGDEFTFTVIKVEPPVILESDKNKQQELMVKAVSGSTQLTEEQLKQILFINNYPVIYKTLSENNNITQLISKSTDVPQDKVVQVFQEMGQVLPDIDTVAKEAKTTEICDKKQLTKEQLYLVTAIYNYPEVYEALANNPLIIKMVSEKTGVAEELVIKAYQEAAKILVSTKTPITSQVPLDESKQDLVKSDNQSVETLSNAKEADLEGNQTETTGQGSLETKDKIDSNNVKTNGENKPPENSSTDGQVQSSPLSGYFSEENTQNPDQTTNPV